MTSIIKQNSSNQLVKGTKGPSYMVRGKPRLIRQVAIQDPENVLANNGKQVSFKESVDTSGCPVHQEQHPGYVERFRTLYAKLTESSHEDDEVEAGVGQVDANGKPSDNTDTTGATPAPELTLVTDNGDTVSPALYDGVFMSDEGRKRDRRVSLGTGHAGTLPRDPSYNETPQIKHGTSLTNLKVQ